MRVDERVDLIAPTVPVAPAVRRLEGGLAVDLRGEPAVVLVSGSGVEQPVVEHAPPRWERALVRTFDLLVALPLFVIAIPVIAVLAAAVRTTSPGPVFYRSRRITRDGRFFDMWKLRTMVVDGDLVLERHFAEHPGAKAAYLRNMKLVDDPRVTPFGKWMRRWSLDELPQLWNVVKGDMSIVGPRPLLPSEAERLGPLFPAVVRVKGGLTGLWQVSGRSTLTFAQRIPLDLRYVAQRSLTGDVAILGRTAWQLVRGRPGAF